MLISQIVQLDAQSNEFARKHAASQIGRSDGGESFADYLAATMNPETSRPEAGEIQAISSTARQSQTESSTRNRTPEEAHLQDARAAETPQERDSSEATRRESEAIREKGARADNDSERISREENSKAEKTHEASVKEPAEKSGNSGNDQRAADGAKGISVASVNTQHSGIEDETDGHSLAVRKGEDASGKAARVTSRRVSETQVEIDVEIDPGEVATERASVVAKKSADSAESKETPEAKDPATEKMADDRSDSDAFRKSKPAREALDERGKVVSAVRTKPDKAEKTSESDDRTMRAERRVEVRDLRSERGHDRGNSDTRDGSDGRKGGGESALGGDHASESELRDSPSTTNRANQFESLRAEGGPSSPASRGNESAARTGGTAANLRHTLQEQLNGEIVRSARLVVRGDGRGDIRLNLKPEHLGTVRITLQMQDGHIAGRIIVDNQTVREVFEQNLASLQKAFEESGLEAGGVEISLADSGNQPDQKSSDEPADRLSVRDVADRFGYSVPDLSTIDEQHDLVDLVV